MVDGGGGVGGGGGGGGGRGVDQRLQGLHGGRVSCCLQRLHGRCVVDRFDPLHVGGIQGFHPPQGGGIGWLHQFQGGGRRVGWLHWLQLNNFFRRLVWAQLQKMKLCEFIWTNADKYLIDYIWC